MKTAKRIVRINYMSGLLGDILNVVRSQSSLNVSTSAVLRALIRHSSDCDALEIRDTALSTGICDKSTLVQFDEDDLSEYVNLLTVHKSVVSEFRGIGCRGFMNVLLRASIFKFVNANVSGRAEIINYVLNRLDEERVAGARRGRPPKAPQKVADTKMELSCRDDEDVLALRDVLVRLRDLGLVADRLLGGSNRR